MRNVRIKFHRMLIAAALAAFLIVPAAVFAVDVSGDPVSAGELGQLENLVVAHDNEGNEVPLESLDEDSYGGFIYVLKNGTSTAKRAKMENKICSIDDEEVANEIFTNKMYSAESLDVIGEVADPDMIAYIEPDYRIYALDDVVEAKSTNDTLYSKNKWMYDMVGAESVWNIGVKGAGRNGNSTPVVAVIDSGLAGCKDAEKQHEDINYSNVTGTWKAEKYSTAEDQNGHGTFVAGEIFATMNNNKGVAGLMPEVKVIPYRTLDAHGSGYVSYSVAAINDIIKNKCADVVNMSLGSENESDSLQEACTKAANQGIIIVAAAGNDGKNICNYPASYKNVISVTAVDSDGSRPYYSNYNDKVDVAAPGSEICGLMYNKTTGYRLMSGTSMATPVVAAMAAMAKSLDSSIDHDAFMRILEKTSTDKGDSGKDIYYGYGIANFAAAYRYITGSAAPTPTTDPNPDPTPTPVPSTNGKITVSLYGGNYYTYTGSAISPGIEAYDTESGEALIYGEDYTTKYYNNTNAGTAAVVATGAGDYAGKSGKAYFVIIGKNLETVAVESGSYVYDGYLQMPSVTVKSGNKTLTKGTDYSLSYSNNVNAGTATVRATGTGNYTGSVLATFTIQRAKNSLDVYSYNASYKAKVLKKKARAYKAIEIDDADGTVTYKCTPVNSKSAKALKFKNGKITVKKKTKKGTYKLEVTVYAAGDENHKPGEVTGTITVKVK